MEADQREVPVNHCVMSKWMKENNIKDAYYAIKESPREAWVKYCNDVENKQTCNKLDLLPSPVASLIEYMQKDLVDTVEKVLSIKPLMSDPLLHGGGVHVSGPGGVLNIHLDYARHPRLPLLERRVNCILYLNPEWKEEWGGATVLTKPDGVTVVSRIYPGFGKLLIMETNDLSYHGVEPVTCPEGEERVTIATYYLGVCRPGVTRERALFVPRRG